MKGLSLRKAARQLGVNVSTLRRDIVKGCPTLHLGEIGRGKGSLVDPEAVLQWRASQRGDVLAVLATVLPELWREGVHKAVKITPAQTGLLLMKIYEHVYERIKREPLTKSAIPPQMRRLCAICLDLIEQGNFEREERHP